MRNVVKTVFVNTKQELSLTTALVVPANLGQSRSIIQQLYPRLLLQQGCLFLKTNVKSQMI